MQISSLGHHRAATYAVGAGASLRSFPIWTLGAVNLLSALLVFLLQPMVARTALPLYGGSAMVWTTALMFFQGTLFLGYLYAHLVATKLQSGTQLVVHGALVLLALFAVPFTVDFGGNPGSLPPTIALLISFSLLAGLPYLVVTTTSPLTQHWLAMLGAEQPHKLYAIGTAGSLLALIMYPVLIEPRLGLARQFSTWSMAFALLAALLLPFMYRQRSRLRRGQAALRPQNANFAPGWRQRLRWTTLAFVPSLLLLATTHRLSTDVASLPLLWVLPLTLYLASYALAFARPTWCRTYPVCEGQLIALVMVGLCLNYQESALLLPLHLVALFLTGLVCHGQLVEARPQNSQISDFYIWLALGGWLGGIAGALVAPYVFDQAWEYPIAVAGAALLRRPVGHGSTRDDLLWPLAIVGTLVAVSAVSWRVAVPAGVIVCCLAIALYLFGRRPVRLAVAFVTVAVGQYLIDQGRVVAHGRSFYGTYKVTESATGSARYLTHGTTIHGSQATNPALARVPLAYYHPSGPLGEIAATLIDQTDWQRIGVIGLGTGSLACYARPNTVVEFFEIDIEIENVARRHFSYLDECPGRSTVQIADGRLGIEAAENSYDTIIVDAFSSDAIPAHLLTTEAIASFVDKLKPAGALVFHISNRYVDLADVISAGVAQFGLSALRQVYEPEPADAEGGALASDWLVATGDATLWDRQRWRRVDPTRVRPWTDEYSNLFGTIRWNSVLQR